MQHLTMLLRRYFTTDPSRPIVVGNGLELTLYLPPRAALMAPEVLGGTYETETIRLLRSLLSPRMAMVDVGAHVGFFSLIAARHVGPFGKVYAFEPHPTLFDLLRKNIEANEVGNIVRPIRSAVSSTPATRTLFLSERDDAESSFYRTPGVRRARGVTVETTTIDGFFAAEGWPSINVMKIDIEGSETAALEGMRELVRRNPRLKLIIEFSPSNQSAAGVSPEEMFAALRSLGFERVFAIEAGLRALTIPQDMRRLAKQYRDRHVNLLCEE